MIIDLRKGFGNFENYNLFKFPDNSIKFELKAIPLPNSKEVTIIISLKSNDDIISLGLIKDVVDRLYPALQKKLIIRYMMYQQDDRKFNDNESFGLKVISNFINSLKFDKISIFHPHSDKVEFLDNCNILTNKDFVSWFLSFGDNLINHKHNFWVIPDAGGYKSQMKMIQDLKQNYFISCSKTRAEDGSLTMYIPPTDLQGKDCFIVDDICLGGNTFINIAKELKKNNCGKLYLVISHGIFNKGIDHLLEHFDCIYTTDSICSLPESDRLKIYNLRV